MTSRGCAHSIAELLGTAGGETPQLTEQHLKLIRGESPEADYEFTPESVAGECSLVVGGSKVPVECNRDHAGSPVLTLAKHRCLDAWASAWHETPRVVPFDFASGMVGGNSAPCPHRRDPQQSGRGLPVARAWILPLRLSACVERHRRRSTQDPSRPHRRPIGASKVQG